MSILYVRFTIQVFSEYYLLKNDFGYRLFLSVPLEDNHNVLMQLVKHVDVVLNAFKQPCYYEVCFIRLNYDNN
jgi:hypothetical protein